MKSYVYVPNPLRSAGRHLCIALTDTLEQLLKTTFVRARSASPLALKRQFIHSAGR
jgi:hypothetical protein